MGDESRIGRVLGIVGDGWDEQVVGQKGKPQLQIRPKNIYYLFIYLLFVKWFSK